jgi:hypothetical protein
MEFMVIRTGATHWQYRRGSLRFASKLTDAAWALIELLKLATQQIGHSQITCLQMVVNAILNLLNRQPVAPAAKEASIHSAGQGVCFYVYPQGGIFAMINPILVPAARKSDARRPPGRGHRDPIDQDDG